MRSQKPYRKRSLKGKTRRGRMLNKPSIHERPAVINNRERTGDFESDTIIGKDHKGVVVTNVCRKSLFVQLKALKNRKTEAMIDALIDFSKATKIHSITLDNGTEFEEYQRLIDKNVEVFFANPYCSNQRARNENEPFARSASIYRYAINGIAKQSRRSFNERSEVKIRTVWLDNI